MVSIEAKGNEVLIRVEGLHKLWAFKNTIRLRKDQIVSVAPADPGLRPPWIKWPGTALPFVICAGTYFGIKRREFWDRTQGGKGIRIDLEKGPFTRIVVDVKNPEQAIRILTP
jgi:hypothetical protein